MRNANEILQNLSEIDAKSRLKISHSRGYKSDKAEYFNRYHKDIVGIPKILLLLCEKSNIMYLCYFNCFQYGFRRNRYGYKLQKVMAHSCRSQYEEKGFARKGAPDSISDVPLKS